MVSLLDVNFLVAIFHSRHAHHEAAHQWFDANATEGWATCPVTISGAIRVLSNHGVGLPDARPAEVARRLRIFCQHPNHEFWSEGISLLDADLFELDFQQGYQQTTDIYLLGLAVGYEARLVTFDTRLSMRAVKDAVEFNLLRL